MGINNYNNRAIARDHNLIRDNLAAIVPLKLFLALIYAVIVFITGKVIGYSKEQLSLLWVLVANQFLASFILYFRTNISGLQYFRTDSLLSVMDRSLMILFTGLLLWGKVISGPFRIEWFVYAQTASYAITMITVASIVRYRSGRFLNRISLKRSLNILKLSYPFALLILLMALFNRVDSVMLERLLPDGKIQAGIYAQSFRIFDAASQFSFLFAMLLLPMFSRMLSRKEEVGELVRTALSLLMVASLSLVLLSVFYNHEIILLLYPEAGPSSPVIFSLLMGGFLFVSVSYVYGTLLTANHNLRQLNYLAATTVALNVGLNLILIPSLSAVGAAIASLASQMYYAIGQVVLARRLLQLAPDRILQVRFVFFVAINAVMGFLSTLVPGWLPGLVVLISTCLLSSLYPSAQARRIPGHPEEGLIRISVQIASSFLHR